MNPRRAFVFALLQTAAVVFVVSLQDPELRRNIVYGLEWGRDHALGWLRGPDLPHATHREVTEVLSRAEAITIEAAEGGA